MSSDFAPLFSALEAIHPIPEKERERLSALLKVLPLAAGEFFVRAGEPTRQIGFMASGLIRYYYVASSGKEFTKHFCFGGNFVSALPALVSGMPSDYSIEALEPTRIITCPWGDWLALASRHPVWGLLHTQVLIGALLRAERRERSLVLDDALTRYQDLLREFPGIEARVRQYDIASYLGITPVALSRIRGRPARRRSD